MSKSHYTGDEKLELQYKTQLKQVAATLFGMHKTFIIRR
jgi:hypothetical protein